MPDPVDQMLNRTIFPEGILESLFQEYFLYPEGLNSLQSISCPLARAQCSDRK